MEKYNNPFLIYGYAGPEFFCDRKEETRKLIAAVENGRNITLMSPRRMGKTGLIQNAFHSIRESHPEVKCFYMDIYSTNSLAEFTQMLARTVIGQLDSTGDKWMNRIIEFFKSCRPVFSADPVTGSPSVTLDFVPEKADATLKEIFAYIKESGKECVIAIDEFQQITEYADKGTEALIRSYIQFIPNAHFIFSGSKRHLMNAMFSLPNRPFYQSTQKMNIEAIDKKVYWEFAVGFLQQKGIVLSEDLFGYFYDMVYGHTWYVQRILNKIYEECSGTVTANDIDNLIADIIGEEEYNYQRQYSLLTINQQKVLKGIAAEGVAESINGSDFIVRHSLGATSSVNRALDYLVNNEYVIELPNGYQVYDHFFAMWLRRGIVGRGC